jgi:hypothetical protein
MFKPLVLLNKKHIPAIILNVLNIIIIAMAAMSIAASASIVLDYQQSIKASENSSAPLEPMSYAKALEYLDAPLRSSAINVAFMFILILAVLALFKTYKGNKLNHLKGPIITAMILCTDLAAVGPWEHEIKHYYTITTTAKNQVCGRSSHTQLYRLEGQHDDPKRMIALTHNAESSPGFKNKRSLGQIVEHRLNSYYYFIRYGVEL